MIHSIHQFNKENNRQALSVIFEGNDLYPDAGFKEKIHIQIAIRNPNCIKRYFIPSAMDENIPKLVYKLKRIIRN